MSSSPIVEEDQVDLFIENISNAIVKHKLSKMDNKYDFDVCGTFEFHITIAIKNKEDIDKFIYCCTELNVKPILIELPYGEQVKQLMTSKYITGSYPSVLKPVFEIVYKMKRYGFDILRVKVESLACNKGVPITDNDAQYEPENRYFEYHFKILLNSEDGKLKLAQLGAKYNAHTSRNAFKRFHDGKYANFLTIRAFNKGRSSATKQFNRLKSALICNKFEVLGCEQEYVVYDSNLDLDEGWANRSHAFTPKCHHIAPLLFFVCSIYYYLT